jgi:transcriptional regulator with XRE-family HTH domain
MKALLDYKSAKKLTQAQLAKVIGVPQGQISGWLNKKRVPGGTSLKRISERTGITLDKLTRDL